MKWIQFLQWRSKIYFAANGTRKHKHPPVYATAIHDSCTHSYTHTNKPNAFTIIHLFHYYRSFFHSFSLSLSISRSMCLSLLNIHLVWWHLSAFCSWQKFHVFIVIAATVVVVSLLSLGSLSLSLSICLSSIRYFCQTSPHRTRLRCKYQANSSKAFHFIIHILFAFNSVAFFGKTLAHFEHGFIY